MSTTSAYGWNIPDNTDLVKDGALAIRTLGNAIDTSMNTALGTRKAGMVLLNTTSFSGVSSFSLATNTFTSTYTNYLMLLNITNSTSNAGPVNLTLRGRSAGSDLTTTDYYFNFRCARQDGTITDRTDNGTTSALIGRTGTGIPKVTYQINIYDPLDMKQFSGFGYGMAANGTFENTIIGGKINVGGTAMDSLTIISTTNVITGSYSIYGWNK